MRAEHVIICSSYVTRLFAHHDCQGIRFLADTFCGTMAKPELLGDIEVMADGQDARSCCYSAFGDNHGTVVQGAVLEEDILDESLCYLSINLFTSSHELAKREVVLKHDEGSDVLLAHIHASHHDGEDCLSLIAELSDILVFVEPEETEETMSTVAGSYVVEEATYVLLEENDDGKGTDAHKLVEDASQELHLHHLADDNPEADKEQNAIEDIDGARLLHQLVAIEEHYRYKENIHEVFEAYCRQGQSLNLEFIIIHSIASLTS